MAWIPLWSIWIIEFLLLPEDVDSTSARFHHDGIYYFNSWLSLFILREILLANWKFKRHKWSKKKQKKLPSTRKKLQTCKKTKTKQKKPPSTTVTSVLYLLVESNTAVKFAMGQIQLHKVTKLQDCHSFQFLPSYSIFQLQVCAGSCLDLLWAKESTNPAYK